MTSCSLPFDRYNLLVEFAVKHMDFQQAELESVLDMVGINLKTDFCRMLTLPNPTEDLRRPFLILSFPLDAKGERYYVQEGDADTISTNQQSLANIIMSRCTLVRAVVELWGIGETLDKCTNRTKQWKESTTGKSIFERHAVEVKTWKTTVHTLGSKYTREEQDAMRYEFRFLKFCGPVRMTDPDNEYLLIREVEMTELGTALYPRYDYQKQIIPENDSRPPLGVYFGRVLATRCTKGRGGVDEYSLKKRVYLGPTSMDAELSFIMTNFGQVEKGSFVLDPFVGTGSILLSCGVRGAYCMGTDIDLRVLRGRSKEENVNSNFQQIGLPRPELVRSDNSLYDRHYRRSTVPMYDAIVTDPPYGIRAGARKSGSRLDEPKAIMDEHRHDHIAQTQPYAVSDVMEDLLDMSARTLVMGGRLVCYQPFTPELGRRIVTMKKVAAYDESKRDEYRAGAWKNGPESAEKCANIREKIMEAAKKKPGYEQKAAVRKEKRKINRDQKKQFKKKLNESERDC